MSADVVVSLADPDWVDALAGIDGVRLVHWDLSGPPPRDDVELVVPPYNGAGGVLHRLADLPRLRAVQLLTAGYEHVVDHLPDGVLLANGRGVHDTSTAELAVGLAIAGRRGIGVAAARQHEQHWVTMSGRPSLADSRVLLIGYGSIGRAVAARLRPFEVTLTAVASRARGGDEHVERVHAVADLPDLVPQADVVILVLPLTAASRHLVDADFLAALPDGALLVNVARGGVVDTDALVAACGTGRIGAALDVTDPEPLPDGHPLWRTPGVLITPHVGGDTTAFVPRGQRFLRDELTHYARTGTLHNVVVGGA